MIQISGKPLDLQTLESEYPRSGPEWPILEAMSSSRENYGYASLDQLRFELKMRMATVKAARELDQSDMDFAIFRKSRCNPAYWSRTDNGGFVLKNGVRPSEAIRDIYLNGSQYATECATAMLIVFYKAVLDVVPDALFDRMFPEIELMDWRHVDPLFRNVGLMRSSGDFFAGDRRYFMNPDVNPETPEWQGENVIVLGPDSYNRHGIGIHKGATMIRELNKNRVGGAEQSAYLLDRAGRPDYTKIWEMLQTYHP
ncbi:MAG: protein-glutamine gamma-glutamyltransferase [Clostridia bacterium]|nr:protein-glutamine gamma-glutamyltransferase [Clostridia bacterium]